MKGPDFGVGSACEVNVVVKRNCGRVRVTSAKVHAGLWSVRNEELVAGADGRRHDDGCGHDDLNGRSEGGRNDEGSISGLECRWHNRSCRLGDGGDCSNSCRDRRSNGRCNG